MWVVSTLLSILVNNAEISRDDEPRAEDGRGAERGTGDGVQAEPVEQVVEAVDIPVVASGGVATLDDVRALREAGAAAVVVGTALYEGRFTLGEAQSAYRRG